MSPQNKSANDTISREKIAVELQFDSLLACSSTPAVLPNKAADPIDSVTYSSIQDSESIETKSCQESVHRRIDIYSSATEITDIISNEGVGESQKN